MFRTYGTKFLPILKCSVYTEHEMCVYGETKYRNLVFDMGQKCTEYPERKNSKFSNVLNIQNTKCVYKGDDIF